MADPILDPSGLAKANFYGQSDSGQQEMLDAAQQAEEALRQRYANPNWFNVAAGFLKPQLGGFTASLGSASQALGENLEKQRANELPIAQYRAQVALMKNVMGQKQAANEIVSRHTGPVTEDLLKQVIARVGADSPVAQGIKAQLEGERANQGILSQQQTLRQGQSGQALQLAQQQFQSGAISREEYQQRLANIEASYAPTQPVTSARPVGAPGTTEKVESASEGNAPVALTEKPAFNVTKTYGTPKKLLDNLEFTESSGRDTALGPNIASMGSNANAMGAYQFIPSTAKMLHDQGVKFNPFDKNESRAAADYYLSTLLKQNGGDWNKALAAYGGFKTTDPSAYIGKITKGVDFDKKEAAPSSVDATGNPVVKPKTEREIITPVFGKQSGLTPEQLATAVKPQEDLAQKRYTGLQEVGADENYRPLERAVSNQIDLINKNKEAAGRVSAVLSRGGPANAFLAALNEGVGISINGLSGQVRLPVETFIKANFKPEDQDLAMTMANNYAAIALAKQKMGSVNPNSARNSELGLYAGLTPSLHTTINASLRALLHFKQDLDFSKAQYDDATKLLFNQHPEYALAQDDPARFSSALNNPGHAKLYEPFAAKHKKIDEAFQRSLKAKP